MPQADQTQHLLAKIVVSTDSGSETIEGRDVHDVLVECDLDQPDMAAITLSNTGKRWSEEIKEGSDIEVKLGLEKEPATVFKGEVVGIEPIYDVRSPQKVVVRALNALHRLARGKKSVAYLNSSDKDIVEKICRNYSPLSASFGSEAPTTKYEHIYQHNQTDLEFLRFRAARIGFELMVEDKTLHFRKRSSDDSNIKLRLGVKEESTLERFLPRLSTANQVSEVRVRAWDPEKKKEIIGSAKPQSSKLGDKTGSATAEDKHKNILAFDVDAPVYSKEEADAIARSILQERLMSFITGDAVSTGDPRLKPGLVVAIEVNDKRFDGKYYVTSVRHRYAHASSGYRTEFKFKRDAQAAPKSGAQQDQQQQQSGAGGGEDRKPTTTQSGAAQGGGAATETQNQNQNQNEKPAETKTSAGVSRESSSTTATASASGDVGGADVSNTTSATLSDSGDMSAANETTVSKDGITGTSNISADSSGVSATGNVEVEKVEDAKKQADDANQKKKDTEAQAETAKDEAGRKTKR